MEKTGENTPMQRTDSAEPLVGGARYRGRPTGYALKVASLTILACLLVASQVFVAIMVFSQKQQIHTLQKDFDGLSRQLHAAQVAPFKLRQPMNHFPQMQAFADLDSVATKAPVKEEKKMESIGVDEMLGLMEENFEMPKFNDTVLGNLKSLKKQLNQSNWKSFESWLRNWIIFHMSQQKPPTPTGSSTKTKCQIRAEVKSSQLDPFRPVCDLKGRYEAIQCWHVIGVCWCVDVDSGAAIEGTFTKGRPKCETANDDDDPIIEDLV
ncbi:H-2 class II histocompatibility antigen gamma chain-like isoform X2 [Syngnathus typhle]|uniref:H-2 class II histocompatibility antigen gamma chain-like isoform X2 n=1 Tax=Syngnathus typhle TaxID=161592 RepID=UPI002A6B50D8|nr:H-2 class II histocompatibility antigen gamma chain-like isoform X2 [Syngnathus typhle]